MNAQCFDFEMAVNCVHEYSLMIIFGCRNYEQSKCRIVDERLVRVFKEVDFCLFLFVDLKIAKNLFGSLYLIENQVYADLRDIQNIPEQGKRYWLLS